jgi:hypothetical protein
MKKFALGLSLLVSMGLGVVGCGSTSSGGSGGSGGSGNGCDAGELPCDGVCIPEIAPTLGGAQGIQASVFNGSCAFSSCHGDTGTQQAGLELSSVDLSEVNLIDVDSTQVAGKRVTPSDSAASYIMNKLLGENMAPNTLMMPVTGTLCESKIDAVQDWIDAGAPVN